LYHPDSVTSRAGRQEVWKVTFEARIIVLKEMLTLPNLDRTSLASTLMYTAWANRWNGNKLSSIKAIRLAKQLDSNPKVKFSKIISTLSRHLGYIFGFTVAEVKIRLFGLEQYL
jgi:hypothetical protein